LKLSENQLVEKMQEGFEKLMKTAPATVRTMTTGFYNGGRAQMMYEVGDFVQYVQYSAILDDRTTDRCARLNGTIMRKDGNFEKIEPPLHYNCRSVILPITEEDVKEQKALSEVTPNQQINNILNNTPGFERL
jgi:SPP1 gp7 family putative phage head morphogenesis protein